MMSDYIISKLSGRFQNAFDVKIDLDLVVHTITISGLARIDTGCTATSLSLCSKSINMTKEQAREYKQQALNMGLARYLSSGVNDSEEYKKQEQYLFSVGRYMECKSIKFVNPIQNLRFNDYAIPAKKIGVSYDRLSDVLIGMDILQHMCFYCDKSIVTDDKANISVGDYVFIGCWKDKITDAFYSALCKYYGVPTGNTIWRRAMNIVRATSASWKALIDEKENFDN